MRIHFFTAPFYFAFIWFRVQGSRGGFAANIPMTIHAAPFFSLLPLEGGAPKGRRLAACNGTPTFGEANPASLRSSAPSRGRGKNDFQGNTDYIVVIRGQELTPPHVPRTSPLFSSVFHTACTLSAPAGHLPLEWKAAIREYPLLKKRHTTLVNLSAPQVPSSRPKWRDPSCRAVNRERGKDEKGSTKVSFE